ncbi:septum formation protein Maf [Nonlabens spongiae]|uniref:dTTP/UTP pyrophosphatase n=1 Tax=Nonlabens spongiae TaxID=331648 RepID=A0A1W6MHE5_9FLAO|nr:Maf family nucleotide pyrophosphatase [Nonlabens spongiae]ARN76926.1 septum formation protein Maf [Nonlabens spongiae]
MLQDKLKNHNIILASQSPRRQELLRGLDIEFVIETRLVNEVYNDQLQGTQITDFLSTLKAKAFTDLAENDFLITSDTIVWLDDRALEKPKTKDEARKMLRQLSGRKHKVHTSVCFTTIDDQKVINDTTEVTFGELNDEEIDYYIDKYQPFDRAGGYGIQDWLGFAKVTSINGCYYNVMGLPLPKVYGFLREMII